MVSRGMGLVTLGGSVGDIMVCCRGAQLEGKVDPSLSIVALKVEVGLTTRTPNFHKFFDGRQHKCFFSVV